MHLSLPFQYRLSLRRGTQRKPRDHTVRGYTIVDVPELAASDLVPTLELSFTGRSQAGESCRFVKRYGSWAGRLFKPVLENNVPIGAARFEAALAEGAVPYKRGVHSGRFDNWKFPTTDIRNGYQGALNPLLSPTHYELLIEMKGEGHPPEGADLGQREMAAQIHLSQAIVLIDGVVHCEVPEPAWNAGMRYPFLVAQDPEPVYAGDFYRLDRMTPSQCQRGRFSYDHDVAVFRPDLLRRDDVRELARSALAQWPKFRLRCRWIGGEIGGDGGLFEQVDAIVAAGDPPQPVQSIAILELYAKARSEMAKHGQRFWDKGHSVPHRAGAIATRWKRERESYIAQHGGHGLSEADLDALAGIDFTSPYDQMACAPYPGDER